MLLFRSKRKPLERLAHRCRVINFAEVSLDRRQIGIADTILNSRSREAIARIKDRRERAPEVVNDIMLVSLWPIELVLRFQRVVHRLANLIGKILIRRVHRRMKHERVVSRNFPAHVRDGP